MQTLKSITQLVPVYAITITLVCTASCY